MRRQCERPGCTGPVDAHYGIDGANLVVWLDNRALGAREHAGSLCRRHADALTVPLGWTLEDRREARPRLFVAAEGDSTRAPAPPRERGARHDASSRGDGGPSLFDSVPAEYATAPAATAPAEEAAPVHPDDAETVALPWSPRLATKGEAIFDGTAGMERPAMGRLLGRAFNFSDDDEVRSDKEAG